MGERGSVVFADASVRIGTWSGVMFELWVGEVSPGQLRDICEVEIDYASTMPDKKMALFSVVRVADITKFGGDARKELEVRTRKIDPYLRASVVVLPESGFAASIVRAILTGLILVSRSKVETDVAASPERAAAWLAPRMPIVGGRRPDQKDITRAYEVFAVEG